MPSVDSRTSPFLRGRGGGASASAAGPASEGPSGATLSEGASVLISRCGSGDSSVPAGLAAGGGASCAAADAGRINAESTPPSASRRRTPSILTRPTPHLALSFRGALFREIVFLFKFSRARGSDYAFE